MALIVKKFGGTSVGSVELIKKLAIRIKAERDKKVDIIVVLSAMSGDTNKLLELAHGIAELPSTADLDMLLATGEQISISLLSMALNELGCPCKSYLGSQVAIYTDSAFNKARITHIDTGQMRQDIASGHVVIVAGFQGVDKHKRITTLGRGGSDTTAVALAASMQAKECQIYTDVKGIYTCDPRVVKDARKLNHITCEEMMELAGSGAKVLQIRSVNFANKYQVPVRVLSSFDDSDKQGTLIDFEENDYMEKTLVSGISLDKDEAQIMLAGIKDIPGIASKVIGAISAKNIVIDMIVQNTSRHGKADFAFTINRSDYKQSLQIANRLGEELQADEVTSNNKIAKLSVVGIGMRSNAGIAETMFSVLAKENINIIMISTSEIKISVVLDEENLETAANCLHKAFDLADIQNEDDF